MKFTRKLLLKRVLVALFFLINLIVAVIINYDDSLIGPIYLYPSIVLFVVSLGFLLIDYFRLKKNK
jgi:hypothetical protein